MELEIDNLPKYCPYCSGKLEQSNSHCHCGYQFPVEKDNTLSKKEQKKLEYKKYRKQMLNLEDNYKRLSFEIDHGILELQYRNALKNLGKSFGNPDEHKQWPLLPLHPWVRVAVLLPLLYSLAEHGFSEGAFKLGFMLYVGPLFVLIIIASFTEKKSDIEIWLILSLILHFLILIGV